MTGMQREKMTEASRHADPAHIARRPVWRQRLVQAERGFVGSFRSDSALFVQFFGASAVLAAGFVFGLGMLQWALVLACLTLALTAEMFHQAFRALLHMEGEPLPLPAQRVQSMATASAMVATSGAALVIALVLGQRLVQLCG